ncbi:MAG: hypothetical protein COS49_01865 [Candidatus Portnoybacteria bacterium CG03_land_8_20_14_0_80_41_10]|uniref:DUF5320 domain-containing protein n=1 Tax=Candidatus Portnoybacteria bacterium CG03_land_8_20_14_0_80_41_10 TaxID=1974808 RepID=A0A2M7BUE8_9BACT|nr:MAG: hypothetical protein COS49_01865 [Candidatus Portnoybacteria bacterium CG03_land_8_20_14_0_80_41_10]
MPAFNGTGPQGQGSRTGRGLGYCRPTGQTNQPGYRRGLGQGWFGRRLGRGFGFGRGWGYPYGGYPDRPDYPYEPTAKEEKEILAEELQGLKEETKRTETRLEELKNKK